MTTRAGWPGVAKRLVISYDDLRAIKADLIYCSISGFGQTGPYKTRPGFDIMAQGTVGFLRMTGAPDGPPAKVGVAINDLAAGATAIYSILGAHLLRQRTGEGQNTMARNRVITRDRRRAAGRALTADVVAVEPRKAAQADQTDTRGFLAELLIRAPHQRRRVPPAQPAVLNVVATGESGCAGASRSA